MVASIHTLMLLTCSLLLLSTAAAINDKHTCIHDVIARRQRESGGNVSVVVEEVGEGPGGEHVYKAAGSGSWQPLRIGVFTADLDDSSRHCTEAGQMRPNFLGATVQCTADDVLTRAKKDILIKKLLPAAVQLHTERLMVERIEGKVKIPYFYGAYCSEFTVPPSHHTDGVSGYDFILYVSAGPTGGNTIAWALTCASREDGHPTVGVSNISPKYIQDVPGTERVLAHEMLHALGFSWPYFDAQQTITTVPHLRGKTNVLVMNSRNVLQRTKEQYGCSNAVGMELEDQGGDGTAGSHWKRRNARDEIMAGIAGICYYTALTIAAMEDLGYYKGVYAKAESMPWGEDAGCALLDDKCVKDGVSQFPSMFCTDDPGKMLCTTTRQEIGFCGITGYLGLPLEFQYFPNSYVGGTAQLMDYCPIIEAYVNAGCATGDVSVMPGSVISANSRCFDVDRVAGFSGVKGVCAPIACDSTSETYRVKFSGQSEYTTCEPGSTVSYQYAGRTVTATCPPYTDICLMMGGDDEPSDDPTGKPSRNTRLAWMTAVVIVVWVAAVCALVLATVW